MKEVRFRFWHTFKEEMRPVEVIEFDTEQVRDSGDWVAFESGVLMQYTGFRDKTTRKIYEGDIISFHAFKNGGGMGGYHEVDYKGIAEVFYEEKSMSYMFRVSKKEIWDMHGTTHYETGECLEVIGNIYENKELLNDKN